MLVPQQPIPRSDIAFDHNFIPLLGMTDVVDRNIVVLTPEEWDRIGLFTLRQHITRGNLPLALGHNPMLNPYILA
jgi:hypothetical protein